MKKMYRIIQIFVKKLDCTTLSRWYIRTGRRHAFLLNEIKQRHANEVYSLKDEDNVINKQYMIQVNRDETELEHHYTVAIHTSLSYVLVKVSKNASAKVKYDATILDVISSDTKDYNNVKQILLPNMFIEFLAFSVRVQESNDCKKIIPLKRFGAIG